MGRRKSRKRKESSSANAASDFQKDEACHASSYGCRDTLSEAYGSWEVALPRAIIEMNPPPEGCGPCLSTKEAAVHDQRVRAEQDARTNLHGLIRSEQSVKMARDFESEAAETKQKLRGIGGDPTKVHEEAKRLCGQLREKYAPGNVKLREYLLSRGWPKARIPKIKDLMRKVKRDGKPTPLPAPAELASSRGGAHRYRREDLDNFWKTWNPCFKW